MKEPVDFSKMSPERIELSQRDFDALLQRLDEPGQYDPRIAKVLSTSAPWDRGLSPAAEAVLAAFDRHPLRADHMSEDLVPALAAALRAAAFQLSFGHATGDGILCEDDLLAIAAELEGE